jgi:hypothetical protein
MQVVERRSGAVARGVLPKLSDELHRPHDVLPYEKPAFEKSSARAGR